MIGGGYDEPDVLAFSSKNVLVAWHDFGVFIWVRTE
jgi:hypothetical protein